MWLLVPEQEKVILSRLAVPWTKSGSHPRCNLDEGPFRSCSQGFRLRWQGSPGRRGLGGGIHSTAGAVF